MRNSKILLGICSVGLFLVLFGMILTKPDLVTAQISNESNSFTYTGINNNSETLYSINFADENTMEVTDENKFLMPSIPVVVNKERVINVNILSNSTNSNILGGDNIKLEDNSNITIIGGIGNGDSIIGANNHNATFFGGKWNKIDNNDSLGVPSVLIGGESNVMNENHEANVIVGGSNNLIYEDSNNVNILGGSDVQVGGENIIAGGSNMNFNSKDDIFIFSDGGGDGSEEGTFTPQTSGAFFLNVSNGVGFGTGSDGNLGAISNGAISLGNININSIDCTVDADTIGVQGVWNGCLVGCTSGSASDSKWELLDHGNLCEEICKTNEKCSQIAVQNNVEEYTSFCTQGLVYTGNSYLCSNRGLNAYKNVVFETYLIDSEEECPSNAHNQCAYRCNSNAHLTGDVTGKKDGVTMCFKDCKLPWDSTISKKHNETIIGYDNVNAYCTSADGDTCATHKANLICVDGDWYTTNSDGKAESKDTTHIYGSCTLKISGCGEGYTLTRRDIIEKNWDYITTWSRAGIIQEFFQEIFGGYSNWGWKPNTHRPDYDSFGFNNNFYWRFGHKVYYFNETPGQKIGIRGKYSLCIGYGPSGECNSNETPCNESCEEPEPTNYHYRFEGCNDGYILDDGVCRKNCILRDGTKINHLSGFTLYNNGSATCPNNCTTHEFVCYDGRFYKSGDYTVTETEIIGPEVDIQSILGSNTCTLVGQQCNGYSIPTSTRNTYSGTSIYSSCQKYTVEHSQCKTGDMVYALTGCRSGNHTENNQYCVSNIKDVYCLGTPPTNASWTGNGLVRATWSGTRNTGSWQTPSCDWQCNAGYYKDGGSCNRCPTGYTSNTGATAQNQCYINCTAGNYLAEANDSSCTACPTGKTKSQHTVYYGDTSSCSDCTSWKPDHSSYYNGCTWKCDAGYYKEAYYTYNNQGSWRCTKCPDGSTSNTGAESLTECYALPQCGTKATQYFVDENDYCSVGDPVMNIGVGEPEVTLTPYWSTVTFGGTAEQIGWIWTCSNNGHDVSCSGRFPYSCTGPCGTVGHGETLSCYASDSAYCPNTCQKESLLCRDGQFGRIVYNLGGGGRGFSTGYFSHTDYTYSSCTLNGDNMSDKWDECHTGYICNTGTYNIVVNNSCQQVTKYTWDRFNCVRGDYTWISCPYGHYCDNAGTYPVYHYVIGAGCVEADSTHIRYKWRGTCNADLGYSLCNQPQSLGCWRNSGAMCASTRGKCIDNSTSREYWGDRESSDPSHHTRYCRPKSSGDGYENVCNIGRITCVG